MTEKSGVGKNLKRKEREWYREEILNVLSFFNSSLEGLNEESLENNKSIYGDNVLRFEKKRRLIDIIFSQLNSPLVYVLIIASGIMTFLEKPLDAGIVLFIVILNTVIGTIQEGRAENTLEALKKIIKGYAVVIRNGKEIVIEDSELVPGDIISLKDGSIIPADARIIEANKLKVNQSSLTGESEPVLKTAEKETKSNLNFNDQNNMLFRGTYVISGLSRAVVVRTGADTLIGEISKKLIDIDTEIPLKKKIKQLSTVILWVVFIASTLLFSVGIIRGISPWDMALVAVAISVSAIPSSLPVIVTLVLASGVWRMSQKNVLVKRLQAVEALGQAKVIAVDKTGTITKNQMTVGKIFVNDRYIDVKGVGYNTSGGFYEHNRKIKLNHLSGDSVLEDADLDLVGKISTFTAIAEFNTSDEDNWKLDLGDPTEAALKILGLKMGMEKAELEDRFLKIHEIPFSMKTKLHATVNVIGNQKILSVAGGPEGILERCGSIWSNGKRKNLDIEEKNKLESVVNKFSSDGYRILALAMSINPPKDINEEALPSLTFVGFVGISDAIRPEVFDSVKKAKAANMKVVMITGDYTKTAESIARQVGIFHDGDKILTGQEISNLSVESLSHVLDNVTVFARVSPDDKLKIIKAFRANGDIVAMTGDGINDALSLVAADLGVSMGQNGTEVAREASDIVLIDDNFGNIISAAEEGRHIFWIIKKVINHLLSANTGELITITLAILIGLPLPLLATQVIWLNMVTDTFLVSSLAVDPKEKNIMSNIYRQSGSSLFDRVILTRILIVSSVMATTTLYLFYLNVGGDMTKAWTISLTMLTAFQALNIYNVKSHYKSIFSKSTFNNKFLILGSLTAIALHLFAIYNPFMQRILSTTSLGVRDWLIIIPLALIIIVVEEIRKFIYRNYFMKLNPELN